PMAGWASRPVGHSGPERGVALSRARQRAELRKGVRGAGAVTSEQEGPHPQFVIQPDRARCAQYDVKIEDVNQLINTALGGEPIGTLYEGERRFEIVARFDRAAITSPSAIGKLPVFTDRGGPIPLSQVADFSLADGQTIIARDNVRRRMTVRCDIVGRDQGGFVADAKRAFAGAVQVPDGYRVRWIGMFENLERASGHFLWVIPLTVVIIYGLLFLTFGRHRESLLVLVSLPFAFLGGSLAW